MQPACARTDQVLAGAPLDDGNIDSGQRQLGCQHQAGWTCSHNDYRMLCHGHPPGSSGGDSASRRGACGKPPVLYNPKVGGVVRGCAVARTLAPPLNPGAGLQNLHFNLSLATEADEFLGCVRILCIAFGTGDTVMDRHDQASSQHYRRCNGLLRSHYGGHISDRLAPAELRAIDREECGVEGGVLSSNVPPRPVPERIAAMDNAPAAPCNNPRHLRVTVTIDGRHCSSREVPE